MMEEEEEEESEEEQQVLFSRTVEKKGDPGNYSFDDTVKEYLTAKFNL